MNRPLLDDMVCPSTMRPHVQSVLDGEYDPGKEWSHLRIRSVIDVGANIGAFSLWARNRWPDCRVRAYEPLASNYRALIVNCLGRGRVRAKRVAVSDVDMDAAPIYYGAHNCGEASLYRGGEQLGSHEIVPVISAERLPRTDMLKVDTEGSELPIISTYRWLRSCQVVAYEYHSESDAAALADLLSPTHGWAKNRPTRRDRGVVVWVRLDLQ